MTSFRLFLLGLCLLLPTPAMGKMPPVAAKLQTTYSDLTAMRATFSQTLRHKESGAQESRTGTLLFQKPLLMRWETGEPSPELLIVTSDEIWNVFPDEEIAYKYSLDLARDARSVIRVITGQSRLEEDFDVAEEGREDGLITLRLYPKEPVQSLVEAVFWVDPLSGLIRRLRIYDFYGNENEVLFTRQETDVRLSRDAFLYTPARGIVVEDRSNADSVMQKPLLQ
ncbi:MAG: outer membrane lipoprotein carrier protein LolA [Desulfovibrio sp.]|jgi:outer membrane lipoprotein carrier protein|nr:outer membrane lipoprotein carrier protein LolA [Desulfovibrio sp.]